MSRNAFGKKSTHQKYYWLINTQRCIGCETCVIACKQEHDLLAGVRYRQVYQINPEQYPGIPTVAISMSCNHCEKPQCLPKCPAKAYHSEDGLIIHDPENCIGCKLCIWACPYNAPQFVEAKGKVEKCNLCHHRLEQGLNPACVDTCLTGAIQLVKVPEDLPKEVKELTDVPGLPQIDTKAKIRLLVPKTLKYPIRRG